MRFGDTALGFVVRASRLRSQQLGAGQDRVHRNVMRFDRHGRQHLLRMHHGDHERAGSPARKRAIVGAAAATQPVAEAVGGERGHQDHISLSERDGRCIRRGHPDAQPTGDPLPAVDPELQIPIGEHYRQQHPNAPIPQHLERLADVRLPGQRRVPRDDPSRSDLGNGEQGAAAFEVIRGPGGPGRQQPRPERGFPRLVPHAE